MTAPTTTADTLDVLDPATGALLGRIPAGGASEADEAVRAARLRVFDLARYPNLSIKVPGLGEFCRRALPPTDPFPFEQPIPPYLELALEGFGPSRVMWGSDYPPVSGREGYRNALRLPQERFERIAALSQGDRDRIFGGTALSVFPLRP